MTTPVEPHDVWESRFQADTTAFATLYDLGLQVAKLEAEWRRYQRRWKLTQPPAQMVIGETS